MASGDSKPKARVLKPAKRALVYEVSTPLLAAIVFIAGGGLLSDFRALLFSGAALSAVLTLGGLIIYAGDVFATRCEVSERGLCVRSGIFVRSEEHANWESIASLTFDQTFRQRLFRIGDISASLSGELFDVLEVEGLSVSDGNLLLELYRERRESTATA